MDNATTTAIPEVQERTSLKIARSSLELAARKCEARDYEAASELAAKVLGLLTGDLSDEARSLRVQCYEVEGDILLGKRELAEALSRYEQCLTARSKFQDRLSEESMALLFKIEKAIGALTISEVDGETDYKGRWKSTLLLSAEIRLGENTNADKSTVEIDKGKLNKLRDGVLNQLERKKKASQFKNDKFGKVLHLIADLTWSAMPVIVLVMTVLMGYVIYRSVVSQGIRLPAAAGNTWQSKVTARMAVSSDAFAGDTTELPTQRVAARKRFNAVQQPLSLSTDFGDDAVFATNGKKPVTVPLCLDNLNNIHMTWLSTLLHDNEWFKLGRYGILDSHGMFFFDQDSTEYRLGQEIHRLAVVRGRSYINPFTNRRAEAQVAAFKGGSIDTAFDQAVKTKFWKGHQPGDVFELHLNAKNRNATVLCGVDGRGKLMPFSQSVPTSKQAAPRMEGVIISAQQNRFSINILIGGCAIIGVLLWFTATRARRPRAKMLLGVGSLLLFAVSIRAALNVW